MSDGARTHLELKCWPEYFAAIWDGLKGFEARENLHNFRVGDRLVLREWNPNGDVYSGRAILALVTYVLPGGRFGIHPNYVVMSISIMWRWDSYQADQAVQP